MRFNLWRRARSVENEYLKSLYIICDIFKKIAQSSGNDQQKYIQKINTKSLLCLQLKGW